LFFIHVPCFLMCILFCLFYLTTCVRVCDSFHGPGPLQEYLRARRFRASLLLHLHLCAFLMQLASLWIPNQTKKKNPYWVTERVPGLPLETRPFVTVLCQGVSRWAQSMWQTENFFMRFYLVLGLAPICVLCHHTLGAHIPTVQFATFSDFCVNFFSSAPSIFFVITIHQVIWRSPGTLVSESSLEWSIDRLSSPRSRHSLDISQRPDH